MTPVTNLLIVANIIVFGLQQLFGEFMLVHFALWPLGEFTDRSSGIVVGFAVWQVVTSAFMHGSLSHLVLNMFGLYMFGRDVEATVGLRRYLAVYSVAVLCASVAQLLVVSYFTSGRIGPTVGASGGVFGILLAFAMLFPKRRVMLLFPPIPMPAWLLVTGFAAVELFSGVFRTSAGIAHFAHLGGMVGALIALGGRRKDLPPRGPAPL